MRPVRHADRMDIRRVVEHLSLQNDAERRAIGFTERELIDRLDDLARAGESESLLYEGAPIAVFGVKTSSDGQYNDTWFIATDRFFDLGVAGIRYARVRAKYYRDRFGLPLRSLSLSPVAEAPKWFRTLGFDEVAVVDGARVFIYR